MKAGLFGLLLAMYCLAASPAWALFNAQVLTGKRNANFKPDSGPSDTISGSELRAAVHLDPIPLVPIGFGLSLAQTAWDDDSSKLGTTEITGTDIDLEVEAWFPLELAGLVPYAKLGYTIAGLYEAKFATIGGLNPRAQYKPSGLSIHAGIKWEFLLRLGVMFEIEKATRKLAFDEIKDGGVITSTPDIDEDSTSFLLGIQAGI